MSNRKVVVDNWSPKPAIATSPQRTQRRSPAPRVLGLVGTVMLHALVFQSVLTGSRTHKIRPPDIQGQGAVFIKSGGVPSETLILIDVPNASMSDKPLLDDIASLGPTAKSTMVTLLSSDSLPHVDIPPESVNDDKTGDAAIDSGDPVARAAMFGRYMGQIDARIERVWRRPRTPVNPNSMPSNEPNPENLDAAAKQDFKCQVRILQEPHGHIEEVQMVACNGSVAWQQSLVAAIFAASPLPAPPNPGVFSHALTMTFSAGEFATGSSADDYELEPAPPTRMADTR
jgi:hypothetical protein